MNALDFLLHGSLTSIINFTSSTQVIQQRSKSVHECTKVYRSMKSGHRIRGSALFQRKESCMMQLTMMYDALSKVGASIVFLGIH